MVSTPTNLCLSLNDFVWDSTKNLARTWQQSVCMRVSFVVPSDLPAGWRMNSSDPELRGLLFSII